MNRLKNDEVLYINTLIKVQHCHVGNALVIIQIRLLRKQTGLIPNSDCMGRTKISLLRHCL